jgi:hypothetical protein
MADVSQALAWRVHSLPKAGHTRAEYEDASAASLEQGRFAIADGASESAFAGAWANLLVQGFTRQGSNLATWLPAARKSWHEAFQDRTITWFAENKFQEGAFASFLGVSFDDGCRRWHAAAVGDCCLFQVRRERLIHAFPVGESSAFGNQPDLICSRPTSRKIKRHRLKGDWRGGDCLLLMTDALAQWFLRQTEQHRTPWKEILSVESPQAFEGSINRIRAGKELRNDDATLMIIEST